MSRRSRPPRVYWDACLFLDLLNKTKGRVETLAAAWDDLGGSEPKTEAITSALTIAEVAFATHEQSQGKLDEDVLARVDGFWAPPPDSPIQIVELYDGIARDARDLIRTAVAGGLALKAHDAIHFATARRWGASRFWTYDERLHKFSGTFGFTVEVPTSERLPLGDPAPRTARSDVESPRVAPDSKSASSSLAESIGTSGPPNGTAGGESCTPPPADGVVNRGPTTVDAAVAPPSATTEADAGTVPPEEGVQPKR